MRIIRGIVAILAAVALAGCSLLHNKDGEKKEQLISELSTIDGVDHVEVTFHATAGGIATAPYPKVHGRDDLSPEEAEKLARLALVRVADLGLGAEQFRYVQRVHSGTFELRISLNFREPGFSPESFTSLFEELRRGASKAVWFNPGSACEIVAEGPSEKLNDWFVAPKPEGCQAIQRTWKHEGIEVRNAGGPLSLRELAPIAQGGKVRAIENGKRVLSLYPADGVEPEQIAAEAAGVVADLPSGHVISIGNGGRVVVADGKVELQPKFENEKSKKLVEAISAHL
ncbi:MAG: hypothetical protein E7L00_07970 [Propionibacteriaceae bacterium]|nr:hypothetical protein [Propionibacteriaceae bacterium]